MASSPPTTTAPSWTSLQEQASVTLEGTRIKDQISLRSQGLGTPHVANKLRLQDASDESEIRLTLYRDHAGWCPYCQKVWALIEEKKIPCRIERINMRSYGPKPKWFTDKVPGGLLPVIELDGKVVTESLVIMQLLEQEFPGEPFGPYGPAMLPAPGDKKNLAAANALLKEERNLFGAWCSLVFRPSMPNLFNKKSQALGAFEAALTKMDESLASTPGPWFLGGEHPDIVDWQYVTHVERMNASVLYWKGVQIRGSGRWPHIDAWFDAFEERPSYMATKSDYYTHVMDIPPQYGPGYEDGGAEADKIRAAIDGKTSWTLEQVDASPDIEPYAASEVAKGPDAWRHEAAVSLTGNGEAVARFACRGMGEPGGGQYSAPLADPLAKPDLEWEEEVGSALRAISAALLDEGGPLAGREGAKAARELAIASREAGRAPGIVACLTYLRDRVGVPRDMSLPAANQLRATLNWYMELME